MKNLKIGLFGHSIATYEPELPTKGYISTIMEKTQSQLLCQGVVCCSTERILYRLKSLKDINMAIIFYPNPHYYFTPKFNGRDFAYVRDPKFDEKLETMRGMDPQQFQNIMNNQPEKQLDEFFFRGTHIDRDEFIAAVKSYNKWFFDPKLQQNRHEGCLLLIDQYLMYKKIPAVHCIKKEWPLPVWFKFQSGVVNYDLQEFQYNQYREHRPMVSANAVNQEGNNIMAEKLLELMEQAIQKVV